MDDRGQAGTGRVYKTQDRVAPVVVNTKGLRRSQSSFQIMCCLGFYSGIDRDVQRTAAYILGHKLKE